jgi:pyridoxine 4-dehydrogenase
MMMEKLAKGGIAYVPVFPLSGLPPLQPSTLVEVAASLQATRLQVALAYFSTVEDALARPSILRR